MSTYIDQPAGHGGGKDTEQSIDVPVHVVAREGNEPDHSKEGRYDGDNICEDEATEMAETSGLVGCDVITGDTDDADCADDLGDAQHHGHDLGYSCHVERRND